MSRSERTLLREFRFVVADGIAGVHPVHWDTVVADAGTFLSRTFLALLEAHLPAGLTPHYALVYRGDAPLAAIVGQSLEIHAADLPSRTEPDPASGWRALEEAALRTLAGARKRLLLLWGASEAVGLGEEWSDLAWDLWWRLWDEAERAAGAAVGAIHLRFLVCGNLLSCGPHGVAFAPGTDPAPLWPAVVEALDRIRRSSTLFGESDIVMIKDLTEAQGSATPSLRQAGYRRFETEPNMILPLDPAWHGLEDYLRALKSEGRSSIRHVLRTLEASGIALEPLDAGTVEARAQELFALYQQVHARQKLRLVALQPDWIPALARTYAHDFRTIGARSRDSGALLGFITLLRDGAGVTGCHVGFHKPTAAKGVPLYLGLLYSALDQALEMGATHLSLGRTALGPKAQLGAHPQPMHGCLKHPNPLLNQAVPSILALLPVPDDAPVRHPFHA